MQGVKIVPFLYLSFLCSFRTSSIIGWIIDVKGSNLKEWPISWMLTKSIPGIFIGKYTIKCAWIKKYIYFRFYSSTPIELTSCCLNHSKSRETCLRTEQARYIWVSPLVAYPVLFLPLRVFPTMPFGKGQALIRSNSNSLDSLCKFQKGVNSPFL